MQKGGAGGPLIVDTIMHSISNSFLDAFQMKKMTTDDLTKTRLKIERMILADVCDVIDEHDVAALRENVLATKSEVDQGRQAFEHDIQFHRLLAMATRNYVFVIIMDALMAVVAHFHSFLRIGLKTSRKAGLAHGRILDAIEKKDRARALAALERHILEIDGTYKSLRNRQEKAETQELSANESA